MLLRSCALLAGCIILLIDVTVAGDLQAGAGAYNRGDYAAALREWRPLAEQGNVDAQYGLGLIYDLGRDVPEDNTEAVKWYRKAAEQGSCHRARHPGCPVPIRGGCAERHRRSREMVPHGC